MSFIADDHTGILIKKAGRLYERVANRNLDKMGITYAQTPFLIRLGETDGLSQKELAQKAGLKQSHIVRTLDRMERDGIIKRVVNEKDKRVYNFFLTPKGKKISLKIEREAKIMQEIVSKNLSEKDIKKVNKILFDIIESLEEFHGEKGLKD